MLTLLYELLYFRAASAADFLRALPLRHMLLHYALIMPPMLPLFSTPFALLRDAMMLDDVFELPSLLIR